MIYCTVYLKKKENNDGRLKLGQDQKKILRTKNKDLRMTEVPHKEEDKEEELL